MKLTSNPDFDVAVIGGGAVGMAAAVALQHTGLTVCQFAPETKFPPGRTAALLVGSIEFLHLIGCWQDLVPTASPLKGIRLIDATGRLIRAPEVVFRASEIGLKAFGYNIANRDLVLELSKSFNGERVSDPVTNIQYGPNVITINNRHRSITTKLVIGADGANSLSRQEAGIDMSSSLHDQSALVTTLSVEFDHECVSTEFHTPEGPFTLVPLSGRRVSLVWMGSPSKLEWAKQLPEAEFNREVETKASSILGRMNMDTQRVVYPLRTGKAERFADKRTMLVGEAAHIFPPIGAQGLNLGFRDVAALAQVCRTFHRDPGSREALNSYHLARVGDVSSRTMAVDILNRSLLTGFLPVQALRGIGLTAASTLPFVKQFLMREGIGRRLAS